MRGLSAPGTDKRSTGETTDLSRLARLAVIGVSCSGKTRFAKQLSELLACQHFELDELVFDEDWQLRGLSAFEIGRLLSSRRWVVDGNNRLHQQRIWQRATAIVWLNYSLPTVLRRAVMRTGRRLITAAKFSGEHRESWSRTLFSRSSILLHVVISYQRLRREYAVLRRNLLTTGARLIELRHPAEAEALLGDLERFRPGERHRSSETDANLVKLVYRSDLGWEVIAREKLVFRVPDLLMLDWDGVDENHCVRALEELCSQEQPALRFRLYRTNRGFHGFLVSERCPARSVRVVEWSRRVGADMRYAWLVLAKDRFDVRVSRRKAGDPLSSCLRDIGSGTVDERLDRILACHDLLVQWVLDDVTIDPIAPDSERIELIAATCRGIDEAVRRQRRTPVGLGGD